MNREFYLDLAASGLRMPLETDLVLHEDPDPPEILEDGYRLGQTMEAAARRYGTPLVLPVMDLRLEKRGLLQMMGNPAVDIDSFHFRGAHGEEQLARVRQSTQRRFPNTPRLIWTRFDIPPRRRASSRSAWQSDRFRC